MQVLGQRRLVLEQHRVEQQQRVRFAFDTPDRAYMPSEYSTSGCASEQKSKTSPRLTREPSHVEDCGQTSGEGETL